jgi:hypothetical protein
MTLARLPEGPSFQGAYEPHVAIDAADTRRAAVVATHPSRGIGLGHDILCWTTADGGETWGSHRVVQPFLEGEGVADPLVAYAPDGALVSIAMVKERAMVDARYEVDRHYTRMTSPTFAEVMETWEADRSKAVTINGICLTVSHDAGRTWSGALVPGSSGGDKTALAVDNRPTSPHRGNVYAAWSDGRQVAFVRSTDGVRSAEAKIHVGDEAAFAQTQIVVGPTGTVHLFWTHAFMNEPNVPRGILYARSTDGGVTFDAQSLIAPHGGGDVVAVMSAAIAKDGSLLVVWSEADEVARERGTQARQTIRWTHSADGSTWSEPQQLVDPPPDVGQGLPAVASTDTGWHVLSYDAGPDETVVRIYSADQNRLNFEATHELASRHFGLQNIFLHGAYQVRRANDLVQVGDYVGLAGAGSQLAAAIVLPEGDAWPSLSCVYAGVFDAWSS